ncbi:MAG TPA: carboxypeptidase regulatory-like domain-containing protein [Terriglobales bacterium]|nr:carboxypeptidase regulatory-like domain-containing protein [Terriglobales bacterium]
MKLSSKLIESFVRVTNKFAARQVTMLFLLLGVFTIQAFAQEATLVGTVTDSSGAVVPNATITITHLATGQVRTLSSNDVGQYVATALPIGNYDVKAQATGFNLADTSGVVLNVGDRRRVDFVLKVGGTKETITVEAAPIVVKTDSGEVSGLITGEQITQLETNGRSLYSIVNLTPGASSLQGDFQIPTPMGGDKNVSFNGQRVAHNLFMVDGAEAADRGGSGSIVMPSIDAIAEFRQLTSNYSAEYGLSSSATVTTALRSGTKTLHASAWWFGRNDAFNARNFFTPRFNGNGSENKMPKLRFNTYGFNVGGPVQFKRSDSPKTFFFYNMEWRDLIQGGSLRTNVPFPSTYGGNLTEAVNFGNCPDVGTPATSSCLLNRNQTSVHVPNFSTLSTAQQQRFSAAGFTSGQPFPSNTIPTSLLDPNAVALLKAGIFPAPTSGRTFIGGADAPTNVKEELVRMDHTFNEKFSIFGHWISEQILTTDIPTRWSGGANLPTVYDTFGNPSYSAVVHTTHIISPSLLNEVGFNYGGNRINILPAGKYKLSDTGFSQHKLFASSTVVTPIINLNNGGKTGSRYDANWWPWSNVADSYQIRDDLSWTHGSHQWKFGGGWLNFRKLQPLQTTTQGNFSFNGNFTGYDFADFLLGLSSGYSEAALKDDRNWNSVSWFGYAQDNWRASKRLTLNLGLRWDGIPHTAEVNGLMSNFYPSLYNPANAPIFANANGTQMCSGADVPKGSGCTATTPSLATGPNPGLNGLLQYTNGLGVPGKTPGVDNGLVNNHWNNWGPRIGFAYDLTGAGRTVLRGGFGIMFERLQGNDMYQAGGNNLFGGSSSLTNVSLSDPHVGVDQGNAVLSTTTLPVTVNDLQALDSKHYKNPTSYQYSLGIQHQLGKQTVLSTSYVGNQNRYLSFRQELNLPDRSLVPTFVTGSTAANTYRKAVPFLGYRSINMAQNGADSIYNSLQVELRSKVRDLSLQAAYTYSRSLDPTTGTGGDDFDLNNTTNPYLGWKNDWGPSIFDRTHVAFVNFIYDVPFFRSSSNGFVKNTIGGWQLSGVVTMESGAPINLGISGNNVCQTIPNCSVRPNQVGAISYPHTATTLSGSLNNSIQWFDPSAFAINLIPGSTTGTFGNLHKNALRGPGRDNWNMALFKNIAFTERLHTELRFEAYNVWNHTQFRGDVNGGGINSAIGGTDVGKITSAFDARTLQLGAKVIF